jgi:lysophospholipase L1-like esterase
VGSARAVALVPEVEEEVVAMRTEAGGSADRSSAGNAGNVGNAGNAARALRSAVPRRLATVLGVAGLLAGVTMGTAGPASAATTRAVPTAVVSLGDSYISGEGGRWQGNASPWLPIGDVWGTDRAAYNCTPDFNSCDHDPARVYGKSYVDGCDRSDTAEILTARIPVDHRVNLACSGATTADVLRAVDGGKSFKGEPPQADQLAAVARQYAVRLVVVSIGGNDLNFASVLEHCAAGYLAPWPFAGPCESKEEPAFAAALAATAPKVRAALASVRRAMQSAGYRDSDYRLVLQSYPSPLPAGGDYRYSQDGYTRYLTGGCPFFNSDSSWARDSAVPRIAQMLQGAAQAEQADFLDLRDAFSGHEVCSTADRQAGAGNTLARPVSPLTAEWVRFVSTTQGRLQESLHPNTYGQLAFGDCLGKLWAAGPGSFGCANSAGRSPSAMVLTRLH